MPLKITQRRESEVPRPPGSGKVNEDLFALKQAMQELAGDMVLEIEAGSEKAVRSIKTLVSRAARELDTNWRHWSVDTKVFAKPKPPTRKRGEPKK